MSEEKTCGYCGKRYRKALNHDGACRYHPDFYFPYDVDKEGEFSKGWQCCLGKDTPAEGCTTGRHDDRVRREYFPNSIRYRYRRIEGEDA